MLLWLGMGMESGHVGVAIECSFACALPCDDTSACARDFLEVIIIVSSSAESLLRGLTDKVVSSPHVCPSRAGVSQAYTNEGKLSITRFSRPFLSCCCV